MAGIIADWEKKGLAGVHCGCCGKWIPDQIDEIGAGWGLCDECADAHDATIRAECAERALVYYCQEVCIEDGEKENAICRRRGGCKWANQLRAAIMAEPPKVAL